MAGKPPQRRIVYIDWFRDKHERLVLKFYGSFQLAMIMEEKLPTDNYE